MNKIYGVILILILFFACSCGNNQAANNMLNPNKQNTAPSSAPAFVDVVPEVVIDTQKTVIIQTEVKDTSKLPPPKIIKDLSKYENIVVNSTGLEDRAGYNASKFIVINNVKCYNVGTIDEQFIKELSNSNPIYSDPILATVAKIAYWDCYDGFADTHHNTLDVDAAKNAYTKAMNWYKCGILDQYEHKTSAVKKAYEKDIKKLKEKYAENVYSRWKINLKIDDDAQRRIWTLKRR